MADNNEFDVADSRREYTRGGLRRADLTAEPLPLFEHWLKQACDAKLADPTAMVVATVDEQRPALSAHRVAQALSMNKGWCFTPISAAAKHIIWRTNPRISLLFPWHMLDRQVIVLGTAERLSTLEVMKYFHQPPERQPDRRLGFTAVQPDFSARHSGK